MVTVHLHHFSETFLLTELYFSSSALHLRYQIGILSYSITGSNVVVLSRLECVVSGLLKVIGLIIDILIQGSETGSKRRPFHFIS